MRTVWNSAFPWIASVSLVCGCGATPGPGGAQTAPSPAATGAPGASDGGAAGKDETAPTTTTAAVGDGGDGQGGKLPEAHSPEPAASSNAAAPKAPHGHDVGRSPQDIRAIIQAHRDEARACYDAALKDHPDIKGDLVMQWTIDPKGAVIQVSLDESRSQIVEPTVSTCIGDVIKKIQFNASQGGFETRAFYPFNFHPHHGTAAPAASPTP